MPPQHDDQETLLENTRECLKKLYLLTDQDRKVQILKIVITNLHNYNLDELGDVLGGEQHGFPADHILSQIDGVFMTLDYPKRQEIEDFVDEECDRRGM